ncbi:MAG: PilT protein-like [Acidobacteria bacterium]|nr:PilT protein-like [Acidobacteriota bacterium]
MVIDTSAILALLFNEPEADDIEVAIDDDPVRLLSSASCLESALVVEARLGEAGGRELDLLLHKAGIELVAVTAEQVEVARSAWRRFGRGRHDAGLNFGDCFAYALAATTGEPLLFKGADFAKTDVRTVKLERE